MGANCLICNNCNSEDDNLRHYNSTREEASKTGSDTCSSLIAKPLHIIFILRNILEVPIPQVSELLGKCPDFPDSINVCCSCDELVEECRKVYGELLQVSRKFTDRKLQVIKIIKDSKEIQGVEECSNCDGSTAECRASDEVNGILKGYHKFVINHEYDKRLENPFVKGDFHAREHEVLLAKQRVDEEKAVDTTLELDVLVKEEVVEDVCLQDHTASLLSDEDYSLQNNWSSESEGDANDKCNDTDWQPSDQKVDNLEDSEVSDQENEDDHGNLNNSTKVKKMRHRICCPFCETTYNPSALFSRMLPISRHLHDCRQEHNGRNHRSSEEISNLTCQMCSKYSCSVEDVPSFVNHLLTCYCRIRKNARKRNKIILNGVPTRKRVYHCSICVQNKNMPSTKTYFTFNKFLNHFVYHKGLIYECTKCDERHANMEDSHTHWRKVHIDILDADPLFDMSKCQRKLQTTPLPVIPWWCPDCGDLFLDESQRDAHVHNKHPSKKTLTHKCDFCEKRYNDEDELKLHRMTVHALEMKKLHKCDLCGDLSLTADLLVTHRRRIHQLDLFECESCGQGFMSESYLNTHRKVHVKKDEEAIASTVESRTITCEVCGKCFIAKSSYKKHCFREHGIGSLKTFTCTVSGCGKSFLVKAVLRDHMGTQHKIGTVFKCSFCGKEFYAKTFLTRHEVEIHESRGPLKRLYCDQCPFKTKWKENLQTHQKLVHNPDRKFSNTPKSKLLGSKGRKATNNDVKPKYPCPEKGCGRSFRSEHYLEYHLAEHRKEEPPFKCQECEKAFYLSGVLNRHIAAVHKSEGKEKAPKAEFKCPEESCGRTFPKKESVDYCLAEHRKEEPKFRCKECNKGFYFPHGLSTHMAVHKNPHRKRSKNAGRQPAWNKCPENGCSESLLGRKALVAHMRTHTKNKRVRSKTASAKKKVTVAKSNEPFLCDACGKSFVGRVGIYLHKRHSLKCRLLRLSEEEAMALTAVCELCGKRCSTKFGLTKHIREMHDGKFSKVCEHCGKGYETKAKLKFHLIKVHNSEDRSGLENRVCPEEGCERIFYKVATLRSHIAQYHRKEEPGFKCEQCGKGFYKQEYLTQHVNVVHKGVRYKYVRSRKKKDVVNE